jgi:hypothetical protein
VSVDGRSFLTVQASQVAAVPEPSSHALTAAGLWALAGQPGDVGARKVRNE